MTATQENKMTIEEYEEHQLTCEGRHEYDNGHLYRVPDEMDIENLTASALVCLFFGTLRKQGYQIYAHTVRIAIPKEPKFYYPDIFITKEADTEYNEYVKYEPELIVEVTSSKNFTRNTVYKFVDYTKIQSLKYYLVVHFLKHITYCHFKDEKGEWTFDIYTLPEEIVPLPLLGIQIHLKEIYQEVSPG